MHNDTGANSAIPELSDTGGFTQAELLAGDLENEAIKRSRDQMSARRAQHFTLEENRRIETVWGRP